MNRTTRARLAKLELVKQGFPRCFQVDEWPDGSRTCQGQPWNPDHARPLDLVLILPRGDYETAN